MGTVTFTGLFADLIEPTESEINIGNSNFPVTDTTNTSRSIASFGSSGSTFVKRTTRQLVETATATISIGINIVGVNFDGPVVLTFEDPGIDINDVYVVDEGGFCNSTNTITMMASDGIGTLVTSTPYSHLKARTNGGSSWVTEVHELPPQPTDEPIVNEDGSTTVVGADGSVTTTSEDGLTTSVTLVDGTQIDTVAQSNGSFDSFTTLPDGTTIDYEESQNGNTNSTTVSPDGTVTIESSSANGSSDEEIISPNGDTYTFEQKVNGRVTIEEYTAATDVTVTSVYQPADSFYTVTTDPPGTDEIFSPNPYQV